MFNKAFSKYIILLIMIMFCLTACDKEMPGNEQSTVTSSEAAGTFEKFYVVRVVDGDTVIVRNDNNEKIRVRLIGIDAPESVAPDDSRNCEEGRIASAYVKEMLNEDDAVYLEYDVEKLDKYDRTLAYVWLSNDTSDYNNMLNYHLVKEGYAKAKDYPPNVKYSEILFGAGK